MNTTKRNRNRAVSAVAKEFTILDSAPGDAVLSAVHRAMQSVGRPSSAALRRFAGEARVQVMIAKAIDLGRAHLAAAGRAEWLIFERRAPTLETANANAIAMSKVPIYKNFQVRDLASIARRPIVKNAIIHKKRALACFEIAASLESEPGLALENVAVAEYALGRTGRALQLWRRLAGLDGRRRPATARIEYIAKSNLAALNLDFGNYKDAADLFDMQRRPVSGELFICARLNEVALAMQTADSTRLDRALGLIFCEADSVALRRFAESRVQSLIARFCNKLTPPTLRALERTVIYS